MRPKVNVRIDRCVHKGVRSSLMNIKIPVYRLCMCASSGVIDKAEWNRTFIRVWHDRVSPKVFYWFPLITVLILRNVHFDHWRKQISNLTGFCFCFSLENIMTENHLRAMS